MHAIAPHDFTGNLDRLLVETFEGPPEEGGSAYLDGGAGLFQTIGSVSAEVASRAPLPGYPTIAAHCVHLGYFVQMLDGILLGEDPVLDWPGSWKVHEVDDAAWRIVRSDLHDRYRQLRATLAARGAWDDDAIGDALAILAHTAYHLGAVRQILRTVER
jgi:hypothetical protein